MPSTDFTFHHFTTSGEYEWSRTLDIARCERIRWPRHLVDSAAAMGYPAWEEERRTDKNVNIATPDFRYLLVLGRRPSYLAIVTAFPVDQRRAARNKQNFQKYIKELGPLELA